MAKLPVLVERLDLELALPKMAAVAGSLQGKGLRAGDRVAFSCESSANLLMAVLGASLVGIIPVLLNPTLVQEERDALLQRADASIEILDTESLVSLFSGPAAELAELPLTRPMLFTSGTTGFPKAVTTGVWTESQARAVFEDEREVWGFDAEDCHLINSPLYHSVATRFASGTLFSGGSILVTSRFDAGSALEVLRSGQATTSFFVPTHLQRLFSHPSLSEDECFSGLRLVAHAGAPCPTSTKLEAFRRFGEPAVFEFYGSTEGQFTICSAAQWRERPGTVGRARPGRRLFTQPLSFRDDVGGDQAQEIWCDVPEFARFEYFRDAAATANAWKGSAFSVGDLGELDDEGYLFLTGRRSDLIITGGSNVYPAELEAVFRKLPEVQDICVFALPDETWGQRVCAAIVARDSLSETALREFATQHLAPFKRPKEFHFVGELPHGPTGKLLRRAVPDFLGLC